MAGSLKMAVEKFAAQYDRGLITEAEFTTKVFEVAVSLVGSQEPDWDGDRDRYYGEGVVNEHPNGLAMLTCEQWVASDADIARMITLLANVLVHRASH